MPTPGRPLYMTVENMGWELYARAIIPERGQAMTLAETDPETAWSKLRRFHDLDTASVEEYGPLGKGTDLPRPGAP